MKRTLALLLALTCSLPVLAAKAPYTYVRVGNSGNVTPTTTTGGTVLMGGGTDVDAAFQWMCGAQRQRRFPGDPRHRHRRLQPLHHEVCARTSIPSRR